MSLVKRSEIPKYINLCAESEYLVKKCDVKYIKYVHDSKESVCLEDLQATFFDTEEDQQKLVILSRLITGNFKDEFISLFEQCDLSIENYKEILTVVACHSNYEILSYLLDTVKVDFDDNYLICRAARQRNPKIIKLLLDRGADPSAYNFFPIIHNLNILGNKKSTNIVLMMLNYCDEIPDVVLVKIVENQNVQVLEYLLANKNIDLNICNGLILLIAIFTWNKDVLNILFDNNIDFSDITDKEKATILYSTNTTIVQLLIDHGMDFNINFDNIRVDQEHKNMSELLYRLDIDINKFVSVMIGDLREYNDYSL